MLKLNRVSAVDAIIHYKEGIVIIERKNPPFGLALPGGLLDPRESCEEAITREVKEETNLDFSGFQFRTYSKPNRDKRGPTITTVFYGIGKGVLKAQSDAKDVKIISLDKTSNLKFAFDHGEIIRDYKELIKNGYRYPTI